MGTFIRIISFVVLTPALSACGGGGGGGGGNDSGSVGTGGTLTLNPTSVTLTAVERDTNPQVQSVTAMYSDPDVAGMVVGYPPGTPQPEWLTLSTTGNASPLQINFAANASGLTPGTYTTTVRVITGTANQTVISLRDIPVTFTVTAFETQLQGNFVVPYIATSGVGGSVVIRGQGLSGVNSVSFGGNAATNVSALSSTEVHADYPALAAGTYLVTLNGGAVPFRGNLVVVDAPAFAAQTLSYPGMSLKEIRSLVYDAERRSVTIGVKDLTVGANSGLLTYAYTTSWQSPTTTTVADLRSVALSLDGKSFFVLGHNAITPVDTSTLVADSSFPGPGFGLDAWGFKNLVIANDGNAIATTGEFVSSGSSALYIFGTGTSNYQIVPSQLLPNYFGLERGTPGVSGNGSRVVLMQGSVASGLTPRVYQYSGSAGALSETLLALNQTVGFSLPVAPALDRSGNRIVLRGTDVYDGNYNLLGTLPATTLAVVLKPDGARAYTYDSNDTVRTFDLTSAPGGGAYPEVGSGAAPPAAVRSSLVLVTMAITPDGGTLFVGGDASVAVMPAR